MVIFPIILTLTLLSQPSQKPIEKSQPKKPPARPTVHRTAEKEKNLSAGLEFGVTFPPGLSIAFGAGVNFGYIVHLENIDIKPGIITGFYKGSDSGSINAQEIGGAYPYETSLTSIPVYINSQLLFHVKSKLLPFLGLGIGSTWVKAEEKFLGYSNEEKKFTPSLLFEGGAEYPAGPGNIYFQLRYMYSRINFLTSGSVNSTGPGIFAGYRFYF